MSFNFDGIDDKLAFTDDSDNDIICMDCEMDACTVYTCPTHGVNVYPTCDCHELCEEPSQACGILRWKTDASDCGAFDYQWFSYDNDLLHLGVPNSEDSDGEA